MLVAQISDIHLGFQPGDPHELNRRRVDAVLAALRAVDPAPDVLIASGDLTEFGTVAAYRTIKGLFDALPFPVLPMMGNHDDRAAFATVFTETPVEDGFVHYVHDTGPLRLILCDTLGDGRHGGEFCDRRAAWLDDVLDAAPRRPTLVALHHPPIATGNGWMTEDPDEPWVARLKAVVARHPQIVRLVAGHVHRGMVTGFAGTTLAVCPSTAPQVAIDFRDVDPATPDGRNMIVAEPPGFALHHWSGSELMTHFGVAGEHPVLARFNARMQPEVQRILAERTGGVRSGGDQSAIPAESLTL